MSTQLDSINIRYMTSEDIPKITSMFTNQGWDSREHVLQRYLTEQQNNLRYVLVAEVNHSITGYVTLLPLAKEGPFKNKYPEIADFNVFESYQNKGIGQALLNNIEKEASMFSSTISLGVGLHKGYGPAQRLYVKRGYMPDGSGVWYNNKPSTIRDMVCNNDDLVLYLSKSLHEKSPQF